MKKTILFTATVVISVVLIAAVSTTIDDFFMPGSQPGDSGNLEHPGKCDNCHGGYNQAVEPAFNWRGSMMAQAARDPLFYACLAVAEQDAPGSGDLCIRCHAPDGWLAGRSTPTDGSALNNNDREGVQCDFCHKLVKPTEIGVNPFPYDPDYNNGTYTNDQEYLGTITMIPPQSGNGTYIAHSDNAKRGPFVDATAKHQMYYSPFHSQSEICGTCHDVSSPVFDDQGNIVPGGINKGKDAFDTRNMLPIERTFSEWSVSEFATTGVSGTPFGGNKETVSTCQDCHMRDVSGVAANKHGTVERTDLPLHDMTGGNTFIPDLVAQLYPDEVNIDALNAGKQRALFMLQNAATMNLSVVPDESGGYAATVDVTNETGHKLPSGYPEGRRMWINLVVYNAAGETVFESGNYAPETGLLDKNGTKIYEIKLGMSDAVASAASTQTKTYDPGESFHFVLNDIVVKDNRIPPRGFTNASFNAIQSPVVDYSYEDGQHNDETLYTLPAESQRVVARLMYQTVSKEYVEFLRDENETNDAGQILYDKWNANGKSAPVVMVEKEIVLQSTNTLVADFSATPETGVAPLTVQFTNQSSGATSYSWDFGDGSTSTAENPEHTYQDPGTFTIVLTVSDGSETDQISKLVVVTEAVPQKFIDADYVTFSRKIDPKGNKTYVTATVNVTDGDGNPVSDALVTAEFTGETNETVSGTTDGAGTLSFDSRSVKNLSSGWCLTITNIEKTNYSFAGASDWCETVKNALISGSGKSEINIDCFPNPFSNKVRFEFVPETTARASIDIFDTSGHKIKTIFEGPVKKGVHYHTDFKPDTEISGMYLYRMTLGNAVYNGKVVYKK